MRIGAVLCLGVLAAGACGIGKAEARRDAAVFLVGAVVPSPGCVASVPLTGVPVVACSGTVAFVVRTARAWPGAPGEAAPDDVQVTVTY